MAARLRRQFWVAAVFLIPVVLFSPTGRETLGFQMPAPMGLRDDVLALVSSLPVVFWAGRRTFLAALRSVWYRTLDGATLVAVAVGASWLYSLAVTLTGGGDVLYDTASVTVTVVLLGQWLTARACVRADRAAQRMLGLVPTYSVLNRDGWSVLLPTSDVVVGDVVLVQSGRRIPVDGEVVQGQAMVDESVFAGDEGLVAKTVGSAVLGASLTASGNLQIRATGVGTDTLVARIVALPRTANTPHLPAHGVANRAAFWLAFCALVGGLVTVIAWLVLGETTQTALRYGIATVAIASPAAFLRSIPAALRAGTDAGSVRGVLFKNSAALEAAARIDTVVVNQSGTLTMGLPEVTVYMPFRSPAARSLPLVAAVEAESEHPLAGALVEYARRCGAVPASGVSEFTSVPGHGAVALVSGERVAVGNSLMMSREQVEMGVLSTKAEFWADRGNVVFAAVGSVLEAVVLLEDTVRSTSADAVADLHLLGAEVTLLTGDTQGTAGGVAGRLSIDTVIAEVPPAGKAAEIERLQRSGRRVAFVGDPVSEAEALEQADLGIVIWKASMPGTETAGLTVMQPDLRKIAVALQIAQRARSTARQNLAWAVGYNVVALPVAAGLLSPWGITLRPELAALLMVGAGFVAALNASRVTWPLTGRGRPAPGIS